MFFPKGAGTNRLIEMYDNIQRRTAEELSTDMFAKSDRETYQPILYETAQQPIYGQFPRAPVLKKEACDPVPLEIGFKPIRSPFPFQWFIIIYIRND